MTPPGWDGGVLEEVRGGGTVSMVVTSFNTLWTWQMLKVNSFSPGCFCGTLEMAISSLGIFQPTGLEHMHLYFGYLLSPGNPTVPLVSPFDRTDRT